MPSACSPSPARSTATCRRRSTSHSRRSTRSSALSAGADAFAPVGDRAAEESFASLLARAVHRAVPVGLAVVLARGELRGLRLYLGVDCHEADELAALTDLPRSTVEPFATLLGPFRAQSVIAAFDFTLEGALLRPAPARAKLDVCRLKVDERTARAEIGALAAAYALDPTPLQRLVADLDDVFGGSKIQYLGVGCRNTTTELAVYLEPAGLARPQT